MRYRNVIFLEIATKRQLPAKEIAKLAELRIYDALSGRGLITDNKDTVTATLEVKNSKQEQPASEEGRGG